MANGNHPGDERFGDHDYRNRQAGDFKRGYDDDSRKAGDTSEYRRYGGSRDFGQTGDSRDGWRDRADSSRDFGYRDREAERSDRDAFGFGDRDRDWYGQPRRDDRTHAPGEKRDFLDRATDEVASWFGNEDAERRREMDQHRGKGPKGWTRSDERIKDDVSDRLADDGRLDASDIEVAVSSGEITLTGTVQARADKRRAEDLAEAVSGVKHVQNNLRVKSASVDEAPLTATTRPYS